MTAFLLNWKEGILFASLMIFLFTPWSRSLRHYILLGLVIYLLNQPLLANFHPGDMGWWLRDPAAWITAVTWVGAAVTFYRWFKGIKGQKMWDALCEVSWEPHLIAFSLIFLTIFLFNLSAISPQFKTQSDFSFPLVILHVPLQYFIGLYLVRSSGKSMRHPIILTLIGVLFFVLVVSSWYLWHTRCSPS